MNPEAYLHHTWIISPVGTSLLTAGASKELFNLLRKAANYGRDDFSTVELDTVRVRIKDVQNTLQGVPATERWNMGAELNGILAIDAIGPEFSHVILHTDTFLGKECANIVANRLKNLGVRHAEAQLVEGLKTTSQDDFAFGIDNLIYWCDQMLPSLRASGNRVVFNLNGGFKSVQAYLQTLGMIYADEICYVFETPGAPLLRIPRLPLRFSSEPLEQYRGLFVRLAAGNDTVEMAAVSALPASYIESRDGLACLSAWGKLAWNSEKERILSESLIEQPGLQIAPSFAADFVKRTDNHERVALQEALAKAAVQWRDSGLKGLRADPGLLYETYSGKGDIGHFRVGKLRISCEPAGAVLQLRHCGQHDYVNDNP